ncbi:protein FAM8A1 [Aplysia californica]|uniref:Protein FAM8A1 n=1 Tax=Aplysia californica TaxID=6500 RepID=A0ABM0JL04_APLCA|nr:protein FAM8A1 [Aplysia californica]
MMADDSDDRRSNGPKVDESSSSSFSLPTETSTSQAVHNQSYKNAREYAQALRPWLWHYQSCCAMQSLAANCALQMQTMSMFSTLNNNSFSPNVSTSQLRHRIDPYGYRRPQNLQNDGVPSPPPQNSNRRQDTPEIPGQGVLMKVPTFWKRVAAELIDFTLLFYIKMIVSLCLMTEFSLDHMSFLSSDELFESFSDMDYDRAFAITFEVIALEIINRVLITIFETLCLYRATVGGVAVGATPGKRLMGLRVVSCESIRSLGHSQVLVSPAGSISLRNAFLRSVIKNFTIAFFFPACLTLFFFKHNRTAYDVIARTVVVEELPV